MKKIILILFLPLIFSSCSKKESLAEEGRYQLVHASESTPFLVDTWTGTVWEMDGSYWINIGTPPLEAKKKGDKTKELNF